MDCIGRKRCLKEVNPEEHPGVYWGEPWKADENCGCCVSCHREFEMLKVLAEIPREDGQFAQYPES
jgi:hypothetical protein